MARNFDAVRGSIGEADFDKDIGPLVDSVKPKIDLVQKEVEHLWGVHALMQQKRATK